jgi:hypothetical protein
MALTVAEAVSIWIERAKGLKIREISAKHEIDPRRIYEVFEGQVHPESLDVARQELKKSAPHLVQKLQLHKPSRKVVKVAKGQGDLFGKPG